MSNNNKKISFSKRQILLGVLLIMSILSTTAIIIIQSTKNFIESKQKLETEYKKLNDQNEKIINEAKKTQKELSSLMEALARLSKVAKPGIEEPGKDWNVYTNKKMGFSFKYPPDLSIIDESGSIYFLERSRFPEGPDGPEIILEAAASIILRTDAPLNESDLEIATQEDIEKLTLLEINQKQFLQYSTNNQYYGYMLVGIPINIRINLAPYFLESGLQVLSTLTPIP